jgi:hypothetical protein
LILKKHLALLSVLLLAPLLIAGVVQSAGPPSITVTSVSYEVVVNGSNWSPDSPVNVYYDFEDADHLVASVTPNKGGKFVVTIPDKYVADVGLHTIIARQGANVATAEHWVAVTAPSDDRLLTPILAIQDKLDDVGDEVAAIEAKLDAGGSFYNFVDTWFNAVDDKIDERADDIEDRLSDMEDQLTDIQDTLADSQAFQIIDTYTGFYSYDDDTETFDIPGTHIVADREVLYYVSMSVINYGDYTIIRINPPNNCEAFSSTEEGFSASPTIASREMVIRVAGHEIYIWYSITVMGPPGTTTYCANPP